MWIHFNCFLGIQLLHKYKFENLVDQKLLSAKVLIYYYFQGTWMYFSSIALNDGSGHFIVRVVKLLTGSKNKTVRCTWYRWRVTKTIYSVCVVGVFITFSTFKILIWNPWTFISFRSLFLTLCILMKFVLPSIFNGLPIDGFYRSEYFLSTFYY